MKTIGITGGIGMGKSTVSAFLENAGYPVIDTDQISRDLVCPDSSCLGRIVSRFGSQILDASGYLDRKVLAEIVFSDVEARRDLESILHPEIRKVWLRRVSDWRKEGRASCFVVIPLLFETGANGSFDLIICVACKTSTQLPRLRQRGWSDAEIERRLKSQMSVDEKMNLSQRVIWTEGSLDVTHDQLQMVLRNLT